MTLIDRALDASETENQRSQSECSARHSRAAGSRGRLSPPAFLKGWSPHPGPL